ARDDALVREDLVRERFEEALLHPLVRIAEAGHFPRPWLDALARRADLVARLVAVAFLEVLTLGREVALEETRFLLPRQEGIRHRLDLVGLEAGEFEGVGESLPRETALQLDACEPLFGRRVEDAAILHQRHRGIFVERRQSEHDHERRSSSVESGPVP